MATATRTPKPKRTFADIMGSYKLYDETEDHGNPSQWKTSFQQRMGYEEAVKIMGDTPETPHSILGVSLSASWVDIKRAYHLKALEVHPDRIALSGLTVERATEMFKKVLAAFTVLKHT